MHIIPLHRMASYGTVWNCIVFDSIALFYMALQIYRMVLHVIALHCMVLLGIALECMVLLGIASHDNGIAWHCMVFHCIACHCILAYGIHESI